MAGKFSYTVNGRTYQRSDWVEYRPELVRGLLPDSILTIAKRLRREEDSTGRTLRMAALEIEELQRQVKALEKELAVYKDAVAEDPDLIVAVFRRLWA